MVDLIVGFLLGLVAYKFGVTLPSLVTKVKGWLNKEKSKVVINVPAPAVTPTPSDDTAK